LFFPYYKILLEILRNLAGLYADRSNEGGFSIQNVKNKLIQFATIDKQKQY